MHTPIPWTLHVRTTREGECGPGIWIVNDQHCTVVDTGALDVWPLSDDDKALIVRAVNHHQRLVDALTMLANVRCGRCGSCNCEVAPEGYCGCKDEETTEYRQLCEARRVLAAATT